MAHTSSGSRLSVCMCVCLCVSEKPHILAGGEFFCPGSAVLCVCCLRCPLTAPTHSQAPLLVLFGKLQLWTVLDENFVPPKNRLGVRQLWEGEKQPEDSVDRPWAWDPPGTTVLVCRENHLDGMSEKGHLKGMHVPKMTR